MTVQDKAVAQLPDLGTLMGLEKFYADNGSIDGQVSAQEIANFCKVGGLPNPIPCIDAGSNEAGFIYVIQPANLIAVTTLVDGQKFRVKVPFSGAVLLQVVGHAALAIRTPDGGKPLVANRSFYLGDTKLGGVYEFEYCATDPYGGGPYFKLATPAMSDAEALIPLNAGYVIEADNTGLVLAGTYKFRVYNPVRKAWEWVYSGGLSQNLFNNTMYLDGADPPVASVSEALPHYVGVFYPKGTGANGITDLRFNLSNAYFGSTFPICTMVGTISGTNFVVTSSTGVPAVGSVLYAPGIAPGTYLAVAVHAWDGVTGTYTVSLPNTYTGGMTATRKYLVDQETPYWIDPNGNINSLVCLIFPKDGGIDNRFNMADAAAHSKSAGCLTSNSPWSLFPAQCLPVTGQFSGTFNNTVYAEDVSQRIYATLWEWRPKANYMLTGTVSNSKSGETTSVYVTMEAAFAGNPPGTVTFKASEFTSSTVGQQGNVTVAASNAYPDGTYLFKVWRKVTGGTATFAWNLSCETMT